MALELERLRALGCNIWFLIGIGQEISGCFIGIGQAISGSFIGIGQAILSILVPKRCTYRPTSLVALELDIGLQLVTSLPQ